MAFADDVPAWALAVYAHPDDAEIAAGGTLARWASAGCAVWLLLVAQGDKGTMDPDADLVALAAQRVDETARAVSLLGFAGHEHLGFRDGEVPDSQELRRAIVRVVRAQRPDVVLCPDPTSVLFGDGYFNHHDHRVTGWATLDAVAPAAANPHYYPEQITAEGLSVHQVRAVYLTGTLEPNTWIDIADTLEQKIDALYCHSSQLTDAGDWFRQFLRERAAEAGGVSGARYSEAFRRLSFAA